MEKNKIIEVLVRAIIKSDDNRILVCKNKGKDYYFFPGGHVEFGESAERALARELKEELGISVKPTSFIGGCEHRFSEDGKDYHEINLVWQTEVDELKTASLEDHLEFFLFNQEQLKKEIIFPEAIVQALLKLVCRP